ncbi:MAG TPA: invasion associated locus B family protein [Rhizomicrobium sp.]|nr:invasion associated locus B family protein [Rhizomicrobium sp.]
MPFAARFTLVAALSALAWPVHAADLPTLLGASRDWTAYQADTGDGKVCYAVSTPTGSVPKRARDPIFVIVSTWPGRNPPAIDEFEVIPGYEYKDGAPASAQAGAVTADLFTQNDKAAGAAWVKDQTAEAALVKAMRGGATLVVTGVSKKGTKLTDTYSLAGLGTALDRAHSACGK